MLKPSNSINFRNSILDSAGWLKDEIFIESLSILFIEPEPTYTDFWAAYETVFPQKRHQAVGKAKQRGLGGDSPLALEWGSELGVSHERLF